MERLELERELQSQVRGVIAQKLAILHAGFPLLLGRDYFLVPDVFAQNQQHVLGLVFIREVEEFFHSLDVKTLHAGIEIKQPDGHAGDRNDGQLQTVALGLDQPPLLDVDVLGINKDINRVEAQFL